LIEAVPDLAKTVAALLKMKTHHNPQIVVKSARKTADREADI